MSLYKGFELAIKKQPELFSAEDREDLLECSSAWSEDSEELNDNVYQWLQTRPDIYQAALRELSREEGGRSKSLPVEERLAGDGTSAPPNNTSDHKTTLLNEIHRSFDDYPPQQTRNNSHN